MRRYLIPGRRQNQRVGVVGRIGSWNEAICHHHIVTTRATQTADRPRIDDLAVRGRAQHEAIFRRPGWCRSGLPIFVHDAQEDEPGAELTSAHEGPATAHAIATIDDGGTSAGSCAIR